MLEVKTDNIHSEDYQDIERIQNLVLRATEVRDQNVK